MPIIITVICIIILVLSLLRYLGSRPVDLNSEKAGEIRKQMSKAANHAHIDEVKFLGDGVMELIFNRDRTPEEYENFAGSSAKKLNGLLSALSSKDRATVRCVYHGQVVAESTFEQKAEVTEAS